MGALVETLRTEYRGEKFLTVFGMVQGHDPALVSKIVESVSEELFVAPIDFRRTYDPTELATHFQKPNRIFGSSEDAMETALEQANGRTVLVTGSFYLVGEVGRFLSSLCGATSLRSG
jgi:folylpolyglutamate synthase/dihydropteroate synthase